VVLSWEFAGLTDVGRKRAHNEDAITFDSSSDFAILADGMGGHNGGEVASGMAVALLEARLIGGLMPADATATGYAATHRLLQTIVDDANSAIFQTGQLDVQLQGMGTTLVLAAFGSARVVLGHIGDSRCYRLRAGELEMLTRDHSLLREQLDAGEITQAEADRSPYRNILTRALGIEREVELEIHDHKVHLGDLFLMCSDGLSDMVPDRDIARILSRNSDLSDMANKLIAMANKNGGWDNISVVLARASHLAVQESAWPK